MRRYIAVGRSFFSQKLGCAKDGTLGAEAWKGLYESIRPMQNGVSVLVGQFSLRF
jgi:eukaryotic translation initiation factor 2C